MIAPSPAYEPTATNPAAGARVPASTYPRDRASRSATPSPLAELMERLHISLGEQLQDFEPEIRSMAWAALDSGGKRFRASLVFYSGWQAGDQPVSNALVRAATVIEIVHLATLVHDDVLDGGTVRRSRATTHAQYGVKPAVLLGDALFAQALHLAATFPDTRVCRDVAAATRRVCSGEIIQTLGRHDAAIMDSARYRRVIELKTAELYAVSCSLGAWLGGYAPGFVRSADSFGRHLGIAYQMADDLVDVFGNEAIAGKTLGTDFRDGNPTLPTILLFERLVAREKQAFLREFGSGDRDAASHWTDRMIELDVQEACESELAAELCRAEDALHAMPEDAPPLPKLLELLARTRAGAEAALARHAAAACANPRT